jgi:predicted enzyme related to lactoylglutathione lyase
MERALGIGGVFFRARDAEALNRWYAEHLGVAGIELWHQEPGPTVWSAFAEDTSYFGRPDQQTMVNFRVRDLDAMLAQLRAAGATVDDKTEDDEHGRFGWAADPEGNRFELWEPSGGA